MKKTKVKGRLASEKKKPLATEQIHIRLTADLHAYLRAKAASDGRTVTGLILFACEKYRRANPLE